MAAHRFRRFNGAKCFYVAGAAGGTFAFALWGFRTLNIAVALLAVGFVTDQLSPLSIREEKEQSER